MKKGVSYVLLGISLIFIAVLLFEFSGYFTGNITKVGCNYHTADTNQDWKIISEETQNMDYCRVYPSFAGCDIYVQPIDSTHVQNADFLRRQNLGEYACNETGQYPLKWIPGIVVDININQGLIGYWKFDDNLLDSSGNVNHGSFVNGGSFVSGKFGNAISLTGSNHVNIPNSAFLNNANLGSAFTYSAWVKVSGVSTKYNGVMGVRGNNGNFSQIDLDGSGRFRCRYDTTSGINNICASTGNVLDNNWHHVVLTYSGGNSALYVNGVLTDSRTIPGILSYVSPYIRLGSAFSMNSFIGIIDEIRIYNRTLSTNEINYLFTGFIEEDPIVEYEYVFTGQERNIDYWTMDFNWSTRKLESYPFSSRGLFYEWDAVVVNSTNTICNSNIRIFDYLNNEIYSGLGGSLPALKKGHYFVECDNDRNEFVVLPENYQPADFMGTQPLKTYPPGDIGTDRTIRAKTNWAVIGTGNKWNEVESNQGVFNWAVFDYRYSLNSDVNIITTARGPVPNWVNQSNSEEYFGLFSNYCNELAKRANGKVHAIEIWNEPDPAHFPNFVGGKDGWINTYVELARVCSAEIKKVNSSIIVLAPTVSGWQFYGTSNQMTTKMKDLGLLNYIDGVNWHDYNLKVQAPDSIYFDQPNRNNYTGDFGSNIGKPRFDTQIEMTKAFAPGKDLYVPELGIYGASDLGIPVTSNRSLKDDSYSDVGNHVGFSRTIKAITMYYGAGVKMIMAHSSVQNHGLNDINILGDRGGFEFDARGPKMKTAAFLLTAHWLNDANFVEMKILDSNQTFLYGFSKDNEDIVFAWKVDGSISQLQENFLNARDIYGREVKVDSLGQEPVIFYSSDMNASELMQEIEYLMV